LTVLNLPQLSQPSFGRRANQLDSLW